MTAADNIFKYFFIVEKIRLNVSSESCARQRIHMKNQALFSSKDNKSKILKCLRLQSLFGTLRVKCFFLELKALVEQKYLVLNHFIRNNNCKNYKY